MSQSLEQDRREFASRRLIAMPIAGTLAWIGIGIAGAMLPVKQAALATFIGTGSIFYLALLVARFTGEDLLRRNQPKNPFDTLFLTGTAQALLVFSIAIPFFLIEPESLPMTVGILTGLMWLPLSWILQNPVGWFHTLTRSAGILFVWYAFPGNRFVLIPAVIVVVYLITIAILEIRWRKQAAKAVAS